MGGTHRTCIPDWRPVNTLDTKKAISTRGERGKVEDHKKEKTSLSVGGGRVKWVHPKK